MGAKLDFRSEAVDANEDLTEKDLEVYSLSFDSNLSFYKEFFWMLTENSFEDIISEDKHQLLWPLVDHKKQEGGNLRQLWKVGLKLYQTNIKDEAEITIIETRERKTFTITTKGKAFGEHRKNPTLHGDFGIIIKIKNTTYTCWLNVNIFQLAHLNECSKQEDENVVECTDKINESEENYCVNCKLRNHHYNLMEIQKCWKLELSRTNENKASLIERVWNKRLQKQVVKDEESFTGLDKAMETCNNAISNSLEPNTSQFSYYLGLLNKRKNIMMKTAQDAIKSYQDEIKVTRYGIALKSHHFDEQPAEEKQIILYFKKVSN